MYCRKKCAQLSVRQCCNRGGFRKGKCPCTRSRADYYHHYRERNDKLQQSYKEDYHHGSPERNDDFRSGEHGSTKAFCRMEDKHGGGWLPDPVWYGGFFCRCKDLYNVLQNCETHIYQQSDVGQNLLCAYPYV